MYVHSGDGEAIKHGTCYIHFFYARMSLYVRFIDFQSTLCNNNDDGVNDEDDNVDHFDMSIGSIAPTQRNVKNEGNYSISVIFPLELKMSMD